MPSGPILRLALRLVVTAAVVSGLLVAAVAQNLPSTTTDGMSLTSAETTALLNTIKTRLDALKQPSEWIDDLLKDLPGVEFADDIGDTQALYQPVSQGPIGRSGDTLYLRAGLDLNRLTNSQLSVITHEMWHAWFDFVPTWIPLLGSAVGRMSNAQDEAMGGFVEQLVQGNTLGDAISGAITEAVHWKGTPQDAVDAIAIVEEHFGASFFSNGLPTARDVDAWARVRRRNPEVQKLEQYLSDTDRSRIETRVAELVAIDALPDDAVLDDPEPPTATAPAPAPATSAGGMPSVTSTGNTGTNSVPAPDPDPPPPARDTADAAAAVPDCAPCVPIALKLREAMRQQQALQAESDQITLRLGQIPAETKQAQQTRDDLRAEYERRLRQTRVRSGNLEAGYYEVGSTVYIGLGATRNGTFVPDVVPDPNAPPDFTDASAPSRSPSMTRLKAKLDAADAALAALRAEEEQLNTRLKQLAPMLAAARAAVEALQRELEACLKACGLTGPIRLDFGAVPGPPLRPAASADGALASIFSGNPTDLLSSLNLYALQTTDGVPYALARPGDPGDDQYQLFVVSFIRAGRSPAAAPAGNTRRGATGWRLPPDREARDDRPIATLTSAARDQAAIGAPGRGIPALSMVATGASSGAALTLEMIDAGGNPIEIVAPDGLVLQAVRQGAVRAAAQSGQAVISTPVIGFCLEYLKPPPPPGTIYQVAPEAVQQRYRAIRPVLEAGRALADARLLRPDSDPDAYATFIRQWAVWTRLEGWDEAAFTREFVAHTRRNVEDAGQVFTEVMRDTLEGAAPHRFRDILVVLVEADGLTGRLPFQLTP